MAQNFRGRFIEAGYPWSMRLRFDGSFTFEETATFVAHVRETVNSETIIVTLTTANGGVVRIDPTTIDIQIPETDVTDWPVGKTVVFDIIRTDNPQKEHLGILIEVPVRKPVTRL